MARFFSWTVGEHDELETLVAVERIVAVTQQIDQGCHGPTATIELTTGTLLVVPDEHWPRLRKELLRDR